LHYAMASQINSQITKSRKFLIRNHFYKSRSHLYSAMFRTVFKKPIIVSSILLVCLLVGFVLVNSRITAWIDGMGFRSMLDKETSKGLKLQARYSPFVRTGLFSMHTDSFEGTDGYTFNPLGIALRRWQIDDIHIRSGSVMLQKTEPTPGAPKGPSPIPWWALFWLYRVYLTDVKADDAAILWELQKKESGIYHTYLEITPNGRDFEYDARGGQLKTPMTPALEVRHVHMLIRKPRLYCSELILGDDDAHPEQTLKMTGDAGLQDDRSIKLKIDINSLNVSPWMPEKLRSHVLGHANGHFDYSSTGSGLETAKGTGHLDVINGVLHALGPVQQYIAVTGSPDPGDLSLKTCEADVSYQQGAISAQNIDVESEGVFRVQGNLSIAKDKTLSGTIELGLTDPYLKWLPTAKQAIFTRTEGNYHFVTVHFSGTSKKPVQDLTPKVIAEVGKSPLLALKLFFNQAGEWFDFN
jgi:hypothetical protein